MQTNNKFMLRPATKQYKKYMYAQSQQLQNSTFLIGYLRGDFGRDGNEWWSSFFDVRPNQKTDDFKKDLDEVINMLRENEDYGPILKDRATMKKYCTRFPDSKIEGECEHYGFILGTEQYIYMIRVVPVRGDYNFYIYCHNKEWFEWYHEKASAGIRFITPDYMEKFILQDGGRIRVVLSDGVTLEKSCRYIDGYHVEIGNNIYHICEYAELCERNRIKVEPILDGGV